MPEPGQMTRQYVITISWDETKTAFDCRSEGDWDPAMILLGVEFERTAVLERARKTGTEQIGLGRPPWRIDP